MREAMRRDLQPPNLHEAQFHYSGLGDWDTVKQARVIHVGSQDQAETIARDYGRQSEPKVTLANPHTGWPEAHVALTPGADRLHELQWNPGTKFHHTVLEDEEANQIHADHAAEVGYRTSLSVGNSNMGLSPDDRRPEKVRSAHEALRRGEVIPYHNVAEGAGGLSYLVPNPDKVLRPKGLPAPEDAKPYHQPTLFDASRYKNPSALDRAGDASSQMRDVTRLSDYRK